MTTKTPQSTTQQLGAAEESAKQRRRHGGGAAGTQQQASPCVCEILTTLNNLLISPHTHSISSWHYSTVADTHTDWHASEGVIVGVDYKKGIVKCSNLRVKFVMPLLISVVILKKTSADHFIFQLKNRTSLTLLAIVLVCLQTV